VLFSQLAVAAYACPGADAMRASVAASEAPCEQHPAPDVPATPLCAAHCQQGSQSLDHRSVAVPAAGFAALPTSWFVPLAEAESAPPTSRELPSLLERPTGPPLPVRHCRFHI
jgi:hypothetical protein